MRTTTIALLLLAAATTAGAQQDPRISLGGGWKDAKQAIRNLELVSHRDKPDNFANANNLGDFGFLNADMAFQRNTLFLGGFNGLQVWDISNPAAPTLRLAFVCPGGQGDVSVYKNLLFMSVEETRGRTDCGKQGVTDTVSADRFRGVRIFDVSDPTNPKQITAVQSCRGSHTHTLVTDPRDKKNVYIYISGTGPARSPNELAGCSAKTPDEDQNTSLFRIDIIQVPVAAPQNAKIVNSPRIFADASGKIAGLWAGGAHGEGTQSTNVTNQCHDITVYTAIRLAAGACSGNGILLDIRDPVHPKRVAEAIDPNFAYWHSATFNNDGTKVLFSDEWGGGTQPRCRATDKMTWGADAIFTIDKKRTMSLAGYYKLPVPQDTTENCVAHNGSIIPVPGRDIMVQAWYQGGISVFDFTDPAHPQEIAFFDRGPMDPTKLYLSGFWSSYWYNGHIYGSEIGRGLDVLDLRPSAFLTQNEIDAAKLVTFDELNVQNQPMYVWPAAFSVARAYLDQLARNDGLAQDKRTSIAAELDRVEKLTERRQRAPLNQLALRISREVRTAGDGVKVRALAGVVKSLAER